MIYAYHCPRCGRDQDRDVRPAARGKQLCGCGVRLRRRYVVAVHVPVHMRASYDKVVEQIAPPEPDLRREWLQAGREQGIIKRHRADLGM